MLDFPIDKADTVLMKYKGNTPHQSAAKLLERMKLRAARSMAERYATKANKGTVPQKHWSAVADILNQTNALDLNPVFNQAELDAKEASTVTQEQSKAPDPAPTTPTPAEHAEAQRVREAAEAELDKAREVCKVLDRELTKANNTLARHIEELKTDPVRALTYDITFTAAARVHVFTSCIAALTDDNGKPTGSKTRVDPREGFMQWDTVPYLLEYAQKEVNRRSRHADKSTSLTSNIMERELLAAWSEVIEIITWRA